VSRFYLWRRLDQPLPLYPIIGCARHALAADKNRRDFAPQVWLETHADTASGRVRQIWFPGNHHDIGVGYPETGISDLTLGWMIREATAAGFTSTCIAWPCSLRSMLSRTMQAAAGAAFGLRACVSPLSGVRGYHI
jgi:hypothetical protein